MKKLVGLGIIILMLSACQQETKTGFIGQQFILTADVPNEVGTFDYIWKITDLPENSELLLSDIQFSEDESQAIFIPDVAGHFTVQVTVWKYNDKLGALAYDYDITKPSTEEIAKQKSQDDWLNETVDETPPIEEVIAEVETVDGNVVQIEKETISEHISTPEKVITKKEPETIIEKPIVIEANFTIQIAAEKDIDIVNKMVNELKEAGYDAYHQKHTTASNQVLYRIRIGKFATKYDALQVADKVNSDQGLPTWVTSYKK